MARVEMMSGIASISGRIGNYCFRTMKSTGKVYVHSLPSNKPRVGSKAPSEAMLAHRARFAAITKIVAQLRREGTRKSSKQLWKIATEAYERSHQ